MTEFVALDAQTHRDVRIITRSGADFGDEMSIVPVIPKEVPLLLASYPVVATKDPETGQFRLSAVLGLSPGENLFLRENEWAASYIPLNIQRQPFRVGAKAGSTPQAPELVITLNTQSPRVSASEGEVLFLEGGAPSAFLERINSILSELVAGEQDTKAFLDSLLETNLLESLHVQFDQKDIGRVTVEGLYSINAEVLAGLGAEDLSRLHARGHLELIFAMKSSLVHLRALIDERNRRAG